MAYVAGSPEVRVGDWYEDCAAEFFIGLGNHVLHTSRVGDGATMVRGPDGKVVMPDLQLFDLIKGQSRLVQVKAKRGAYSYKKLQIDCTGMDFPDWEACLRMNTGGVPVDLALVHLQWPVRLPTLSEITPKLLWQTVDVLAQRGPMRFENEQFPHGAAVWDVNDFEILGDLPNPPDDILAELAAIKCKFRKWEVPPRLRSPGQLDLFGHNSAQPDERLVWTGKVFRGTQAGTVRGFIYNHHSGRRVEFTGTKDPRPSGGYLLVGSVVAA